MMLALALILGIGFVVLLVIAALLLGRGAGGSRFTGSQDVGGSPGAMNSWIPLNESPPSASPDDLEMTEDSAIDSGASGNEGSELGVSDFASPDFGGADYGGCDSGGGGSE